MIPPLDLTLYRYHIAIHPEVAGKKREQMVRLLLERPTLAESSRDLVTDFKDNLISRQKLPLTEHHIAYRAEKEDESRDHATVHRVAIQATGTLTVAQLMEFLNSTSVTAVYTEKLPIIQALNILIRNYTKSNGNLAAVGSSKTYALASNWQYDLKRGLIALRGFFSSVRVATGRILVNVNVSHGAFYAAQPLTRMMEPYLRDINKLRSFVQKVRVKVTHLRARKNRSGEVIDTVKTIFGLASMRDGRGGAHPPRVAYDGAPPTAVQFARESPAGPSNPSGGKSRSPPKGVPKGVPQGGPGGAPTRPEYVQVSEYFLRKAAFPFPVCFSMCGVMLIDS